MIKLQNLTKVYETLNYNVIALSDANFEFDKGEVVVLLGRSGSGKSTLLNILGGFDRDYAGKYRFEDEDMKQKTEQEIDEIRKRKIGFVFQNYVLLENLTVQENVELALKVIGVSHAASRRRATLHALKLVGLRDHAEKYPYQISGGQRQRVAIARAIVKNPDVIIADEPTAALDTRTGKEILTLLKDLSRNKLLIIATHNKTIVRDYGSRVIELKSGYTIQDQLIIDPNKVHVDDLDLIIDQEIEQDEEKVKKLITIESSIKEENKETVLKDLGVDLTKFRLNTQNEFNIDEEKKKQLIKERIKNSSLTTRIYRFLRMEDRFHGKKIYANKSFLRNIHLHLFSAFIFVIFLLAIVLTMNFVSEIFSGFNEKSVYVRDTFNSHKVIFAEDYYDVGEDNQTFYEDMEDHFIINFTQTEIEHSNFIDELYIDANTQYIYTQQLMHYLDNEISNNKLDIPMSIYYNNSVLMQTKYNEEIVFESFQPYYENILVKPRVFTYLSQFSDIEFDDRSMPKFNYVFSETNTDILEEYMIAGGRLPKNDEEVVIPVSYLFQHNLFSTSEFKDANGNELNSIPSEAIYKAFEDLSPEQKTIEITNMTITVTDDGKGSYILTETPTKHSFKIVGILNLSGDINPYLEKNNTVLSSGESHQDFSLVFSQKSSSYLSYVLDDQTEEKTFHKAIHYVEFNNEDFQEQNVQSLINTFKEEFYQTRLDEVSLTMNNWINELNTASELIQTYIKADLAGEDPDDQFLDSPIDETLFSNVTYRTLLNYYIAQHLYVTSNKTEFDNLCRNCDYNNRNFEDLLESADEAYQRQLLVENQRPILVRFGNMNSLTYQEATNRLIYQQHGAYFNNHFYNSKADYKTFVSLEGIYSKEVTGITSLIYLMIPRDLVESLGVFNHLITMIQDIESSYLVQEFLSITNLDLLLYSLSTNALRSIILIILFLIIHVILILSIILLCTVLINLYNNIYETATQMRIKELASLRVMGTSYNDIYDMVRYENNLVAALSYSMFLAAYILLSHLHHVIELTKYHFYMPLLGIFFNIKLQNIFTINYTGLIFASLVFYFLVFKWIIKRVSKKKIRNIDTIKAIRDGENV